MRSLLQGYCETLLLVLLAGGFFMLVGTGQIGLPVTVLGFLALTTRTILLVRGNRWQLPPRWANVATLVFLALLPLDTYFISGSFITALAHLVVCAAVLKLFSTTRARDYFYLGVLAFLEVLAATTLTVSSSFLLYFVLFVVLSICVFTGFEMLRAESGENLIVVQQASARRLRLRGTLLTTSLAMGVAIVVLASAIFFLLPRMSFSYWSPLHNGTAITGFSDQVQLGEIGTLQQSDQIVMHVKVLSASASINDLLWNGRVLTSFDGHSWSDSFPLRLLPLQERGNWFRALPSPSKPHSYFRYQAVLEPAASDVLFIPPRLLGITAKVRELGSDRGGTLQVLAPPDAPLLYSGMSDLYAPPDSVLRKAIAQITSASLHLAPVYWQVPPGLDPRIQRLALRITASHHSEIGKMRALQDYLKTHYRYTLNLRESGPDPLADFLFRVKAGHCEYFASALAIMGRMLGIPTRVVNGFRTGQLNRLTGQYVFRGRDAHSWVQAYFRMPTGTGYWIAFDPTAADSAYADTGWSRLQMWLDAANTFWREWVVNYDFGHQVRLAHRTHRSLRRNLGELFSSVLQWPRSFKTKLSFGAERLRKGARSALSHETTFLLVGLGAVLLLLGSLWRMRHRPPELEQQPLSRVARQARHSYRQLQANLASADFVRAPSDTGDELLAHLPSGELYDSVRAFLARYELLRFAPNSPLSDASLRPELRRVQDALKRLPRGRQAT